LIIRRQGLTRPVDLGATGDRTVWQATRINGVTTRLVQNRTLRGLSGASTRERLTLIRLFEELRALGYEGGYDAVRRELNAWLIDKCVAYAKAHPDPERPDQTSPATVGLVPPLVCSKRTAPSRSSISRRRRLDHASQSGLAKLCPDLPNEQEGAANWSGG
jgi:hypothetical protein